MKVSLVVATLVITSAVPASPAPSVSSGQALKAMEGVAARTLPQGYAGQWTDTAFQEKRAEGKTAIIRADAPGRKAGLIRYPCLVAFKIFDRSIRTSQCRSNG